MAVDVIIDPSSGQIYWNDAAGSGTQTIAISGNATNAINIVGYSNFFSPGGAGSGTNILGTFNDSATSTFVPGTNAYDLGSTSLRWNFYGTGGNFTGAISTSSSTASTNSTTGALIVTGGVGIGGSLNTATGNTSSISGVSFYNSRAQNGFTINTTGSYSFNIQDAANNQRLNYHGDSNRTEFRGNNASHEIRIYNQNESAYTGFKSNSSGTVTYTLPAGDGTTNQVLYTNGAAALGWTTPSGSAAGSSTWVQYNQGGAFGATSALTFTPSTGILSSTFLTSSNQAANEGGEIVLNYPSSGTALTTTITIDIYQNRLRFFETGGANRGGYIDFTSCASSVGTNLLVGSGASGLTSLNGLTASTQTFAVGTSGTDFNISSSTSTHTFNIPYAAAGATGLITTQAQTIAGAKTFSGNTAVTSSTAATSTSTGALVVTGGVGIGGSLWTSTTNFSSIAGVGISNSAIISGLWSGTAVTLAYGGTNNNLSGIAQSYTLAIYNATGTAITNISSGTASSILFQSSNSVSPSWVGQSTLVVGGASTAANIQGGALGNIHYQTGANTTGFVTNAAGSGASVLTQTGNAAPAFLGQNQLLVGSASTSAQVVTDASTATRYIVGTVLNTASSGGTVLSTGSGITIGNSLLTTGSLAVTSSTGSTNALTGALVVTGGVGIGGTLSVGTSVGSSNLTYSATGVLAGFATSVNSYAQVVIQNASTGATASADFIVNNNLSTDATYYGSMGMNSSNFTGAGSLNLPNAVYFTSTTGDLVLGSTTANILRFVYNAGSTDSMQITGTAVSVMYTTASTSTTTGALTVLGGVGIGGSLWTATTNFSSISGVGHSNSAITSGVWSGTAISAVNGGTGQVSYAIGDILYASSTTALSKLSAGTAGSVLASGGAGAAPYWKVDATGAGGGSPGGNIYEIQYNAGGGSFGSTTRLTYNKNGNSEFIVSTPYLVGTQGVINIGPNAFDGVTLGFFNGSSNGTQIAVNAANGFIGNFADFNLNGSSKFTIGYDGKITVVGVYSLPTTAGTAGSVLTSNGTGGQFYWSAPGTGGGGSGTVTSGTAGSVAYYTGTGTTVGGAPGFTYTTSGTASTINVFGGSAIGTTIFTVQATSSTSVRVGIGTNLPQYELEIVGEISATNKSFVIDHPTKQGKKLRYGSLEGPENGVYVRGELNNSNIIETPEHWIGLVHPDSFTVTLTPIGRFAQLYVEKIEDYKIYISDNCMNPIHCYYTVWAERKDIPKLITEY